MGCSTCGGGRRRPSPRAAGAAENVDHDPRPHVWEVDFPNGARQQFDYRWQANAASAVGDGSTPRKVYVDAHSGRRR